MYNIAIIFHSGYWDESIDEWVFVNADVTRYQQVTEQQLSMLRMYINDLPRLAGLTSPKTPSVAQWNVRIIANPHDDSMMLSRNAEIEDIIAALQMERQATLDKKKAAKEQREQKRRQKELEQLQKLKEKYESQDAT